MPSFAGSALQQRNRPKNRLQDPLHPLHADMQLRRGRDRRSPDHQQNQRLARVHSEGHRGFPEVPDFLRDRNTERPVVRGFRPGIQAEPG